MLRFVDDVLQMCRLPDQWMSVRMHSKFAFVHINPNHLKNQAVHPTCIRCAKEADQQGLVWPHRSAAVFSPALAVCIAPRSSPPHIAFIEFLWTVTEAGTLLPLRHDLFISHYHTFTSRHSLACAVAKCRLEIAESVLKPFPVIQFPSFFFNPCLLDTVAPSRQLLSGGRAIAREFCVGYTIHKGWWPSGVVLLRKPLDALL